MIRREGDCPDWDSPIKSLRVAHGATPNDPIAAREADSIFEAFQSLPDHSIHFGNVN
jgi:hypothetical protein